jgi:hypothetical protein
VSALMRRWLRRYGPPMLMVGLVVIVYSSTVAPGVMPEDAGEFQTHFYALKPTHPTGYPFLILLGKLWVTIWPLGSVADRGNLLAMLLSAGAVLATYSAVVYLTGEPWSAFVAGLTLAFTPSLWFHSSKAGAYPFHAFLVSLSWLTLLRWQQKKDTLVPVALAMGMGLSHHRMFLMALPALGLFLVLQDPALLRRGRQLVGLTLLGILPFLSYILLPLRGVWPLSRFLSHVLVVGTDMMGGVFSVRGLAALWQRWRDVVWPNLLGGSGLLGFLLGLGGLVLLSGRRRWPRLSRRQRVLVSTAYLLLIFVHLAFFLAYVIVPDDRRYYVPVDISLSVGVGLAAAWVMRRGRLLARPLLEWAWRGGLMLLLLMVPAWELYHNRPQGDQEHGRFVDHMIREGLATVETNATIIASSGFVTAYQYYLQVEGWRPDLTINTLRAEEAAALIQDGHPVYFHEPMYGFDQPDSGYVWFPLWRGGLDRVLPQMLPDEQAVAANYSFGPAWRLVSVATSATSLQPDTFVGLWLRWETGTSMPETTGLSVWLEDEWGHDWWRQDVPWKRAVASLDVTGPVSTAHYLVVPAGMPPGRYRWNVLVYDDQGPWGEPWQTEVTVERPTSPLSPDRFPLSHRLSQPWVVGPIAMLGHNCAEEPLKAGNHLRLSLLWQALDTPADDWQMRLRIEGTDRRKETPLSPLMPSYPTHQWQAGDLFLGDVALRIPANWPSGRYRLILELHRSQEITAYPLRVLHIVKRPVLRRAPRAANRREDRLGEAIHLLGYDVQPQAVRPGETVNLTLYWQAVGAPGENYKVFNHLVGADGFLAGQQDGLPGGGAVLSSEWVRGEVVVDRYEIGVQEGSPPGEYVLYTGMYQPDDGLRLPAWDGANSRWLNDMIALDTVSVTTR